MVDGYHDELDKPVVVTMKYQLWEVVIEMWNIMLAAPSIHLPVQTVERVFMIFCLLANLNILGIFQGTLTTSFSTVTYYKDYNTLQELDDSGLPIYVGSRSVSGYSVSAGW